MNRGEAFLLVFELYWGPTGASPGELAVGATVTGAWISQDGGALTPATNGVDEIGGGLYSLQLTAAEMTADNVDVIEAATDCLAMTAHMATDSPLDATRFADGAFDAVWTRSIANFENAADARSPLWGMAKLINAIVTTTLKIRVKKTDDTTDLFTQTLTRDASAKPVTGIKTD